MGCGAHATCEEQSSGHESAQPQPEARGRSLLLLNPVRERWVEGHWALSAPVQYGAGAVGGGGRMLRGLEASISSLHLGSLNLEYHFEKEKDEFKY